MIAFAIVATIVTLAFVAMTAWSVEDISNYKNTIYLNDSLYNVKVDSLNKIDMAKTILSMKEGKHEDNLYEDNPYIIKKKTNSLSISSDIPISSNIDGEILTSNTFNVDVLPKKIIDNGNYNRGYCDYGRVYAASG